MTKPGDRVGAILSGTGGDNPTVQFLGYGTYVGDEVPDADAAGWVAEALREAGATNPKSVLDNGDVVWGCECWFGEESAFDRRFAGCERIPATIGEVRAAYREAGVEPYAAEHRPGGER